MCLQVPIRSLGVGVSERREPPIVVSRNEPQSLTASLEYLLRTSLSVSCGNFSFAIAFLPQDPATRSVPVSGFY